jgi:CBS domain containing-hemolysin-like protein
MSAPVALVVAGLLMLFGGFFTAAEFALLAARRSRIEQLAAEGDRRARHALAGMRELSLMLAGAQLGITATSLGLGAVAEPALARVIENILEDSFTLSSPVRHAIAFVIALAIVVFLHMVVGEMAPKSWAISAPEQNTLRMARAYRFYVWTFRPVLVLLNMTGNVVLRALRVEPQDERAMAHSAADLLFLLEESADQGDIEADQHELFARSLHLSGRVAADAMTLRRDIVAAPADRSVSELVELAHSTGRTRVLIYENDLDHVLGFVHAKDLLLLSAEARSTATARMLVRPAMVTPDGHLLEDLLLEMRTQRQHLAVVVDELGMVVGVVTLEDVIEELIGEFDDESDQQFHDCELLDDGSFRIGGTVRPDEFSACPGVELPEGDWQTVAGYVIDAADGIPSVGDVVHTDLGTFEVVAMDGYAIDELTVRLTEAATEPQSQ